MAGWPAGYPSRGAWLFRNIKEDFPFAPILESIEISQEWPDMVATFSCEVKWASGLSFSVEDEVRVLFRGDRIFAGHLKTVEETAASEFGPRIWRLEAQDFTAKLGHALIRQRAMRKKEKALRRVRWIVSYLHHAWHVDDHEYDVPDEDVEKEDMYGMTVAEALDSVINETGMRPAWIDLDNKLWVVGAAHTTAAPFDLDNDAPDYSTSFPFSEFVYRQDGVERANAILVEPEKRKDSRWSTAPANIATYEWGDSSGRVELFISEEEIRTARAAERKGDTVLQRRKVPETEATLVCWEPGIWAGMSVPLTEGQWDHDQTMRVVRVVITAVDPKDDEGKAYLRSELTLTNKPKRRTPKVGRKEGETADVRKHAVDRFDRTATPPTPTVGAGFSPSKLDYRIEWAMQGSFSDGVYTPGAPTTPYFFPIGSHYGELVYDQIGWFNTAHPFTPCGVGLGAMDGWRELEHWKAVTYPDPPAGTQGCLLTIAAPDSLQGAAVTFGVAIRASLTQPTGLRGGQVVGHIGAAGGVVYIPAGYIQDGGGVLWVGYSAGWDPPHSGLWWCHHSPPPESALSGSAAGMSPTAWNWATAADPLDLGSASSDEDAPWGESSWEWQVTNADGSPVFGIDGDALYVTDGAVSVTLTGGTGE